MSEKAERENDEQQDLSKKTVGELLKGLRPGQLRAAVATLVVVVVGIATAAYKLGQHEPVGKDLNDGKPTAESGHVRVGSINTENTVSPAMSFVRG